METMDTNTTRLVLPIWHPAEPSIGSNSEPWCREECSQHDGKRCRVTGFRPGHICEPAVVAIVRDWKRRGGNPHDEKEDPE